MTQVLDVKGSAFPIAIHPGMVFESTTMSGLYAEYFKEFTFDKFHNKKRVGFIRDFAMGDLIMLIPVVRQFKQHYNVKEVVIYTSEEYRILLRSLFSDISFLNNMSTSSNHQCDILFNLNGLVEKDHSITNTERFQHRVHLFLSNLGISDIKKSIWNSSKPLNLYGVIMPKSDKKLIGLQLRGSGHMKTLPQDYVREIAHELSKKYRVVLIDQSKDQGFEGKDIINLCGKLNPYQVTALLSKLDCCITMDSGVLWLAHVADCPVLTLLGPTREQERLSLHPRYPSKAKGINISEMLGCSPCFETKVNCKGRIRCMKDFDRVQLLNLIKVKISEIVGV
jgi:ADP-heptose:LPS heptosyltransferase